MHENPITKLRKTMPPSELIRRRDPNTAVAKFPFSKFLVETEEEDYVYSSRVQKLLKKWQLEEEGKEVPEEDHEDEGSGSDLEEDLKEYEEQNRTMLEKLREQAIRFRDGKGRKKKVDEHLQETSEESSLDKYFLLFQSVVSKNPEQVLRYQRGAIPLWVRKEERPTPADIPPCSNCGAERVFEFQVTIICEVHQIILCSNTYLIM
jgi:hypothetical protein